MISKVETKEKEVKRGVVGGKGIKGKKGKGR